MSDRELLEMAAKAFWSSEIDDTCSVHWIEGIECIGFTHADNQDHNGEDREFLWNPLAYDWDALQLAVKLGMLIDIPGVRQDCDSIEVVAGKPKYGYVEVFEKASDDPYAATRRAIVRAAAEIGKDMP